MILEWVSEHMLQDPFILMSLVFAPVNCRHVGNIGPAGAVGGVRIPLKLILSHKVLRRNVPLDGGALDDGAKVEELTVSVGHEVAEVGRQLQRVDGLVVVGLEHERDVGTVLVYPSVCSGIIVETKVA